MTRRRFKWNMLVGILAICGLFALGAQGCSSSSGGGAVSTCGGEGDDCCAGDACDTGLTCTNGSCVTATGSCGGQGDACCTTGSACNTGLTCTNGSCVGTTPPTDASMPPPATDASVPGTCTQDPSVTGCDSSDGYSCTGSDTPDEMDPTLLCSDGVLSTGGNVDYCCATLTGGTCGADPTVTGCAVGIGFSCTGSDTPAQDDANLNCSTGVAGNAGSTLYCCCDGDCPTEPTSTCDYDSTVTGCIVGDGYSCLGSDTPDEADSTLICSDGSPGNAGSTLYCCLTLTTGTCGADPTVTGCDDFSVGFSCTGSDTPSEDDPTLDCSAGVPGNAGSTLFCCTND